MKYDICSDADNKFWAVREIREHVPSEFPSVGVDEALKLSLLEELLDTKNWVKK